VKDQSLNIMKINGYLEEFFKLELK